MWRYGNCESPGFTHWSGVVGLVAGAFSAVVGFYSLLVVARGYGIFGNWDNKDSLDDKEVQEVDNKEKFVQHFYVYTRNAAAFVSARVSVFMCFGQRIVE